MRQTSKALIYSVNKDWRWSPEAWGVIAKAVFWGAVIGAIGIALIAGKVQKNQEEERRNNAAVTKVCGD